MRRTPPKGPGRAPRFVCAPPRKRQLRISWVTIHSCRGSVYTISSKPYSITDSNKKLLSQSKDDPEDRMRHAISAQRSSGGARNDRRLVAPLEFYFR